MEGLSARGLPARSWPDLIGLLQPATTPAARSSPRPGRGDRPGDLAARLQRVQRPAGRPARAAVLVRAPLQRAATPLPGAGALPAELPAVALAGRAVRDGRGERDLRRHRRAGRVAGRAGRAVVPAAAVRAGPEPLATPEEAAGVPVHRRASGSSSAQRRDGQALGSPETVRRQLTELLDRTGADELMLTTMVYDVGRPGAVVRAGRREGRRRALPERLKHALHSHVTPPSRKTSNFMTGGGTAFPVGTGRGCCGVVHRVAS